MRAWKRVFSVGLSLALCAGLVMPSFAASFKDLQNAIDGNTLEGADLGDGRWGYGSALNEENTKYEIEAWNGTRNVLDNEGQETGETAATCHIQLNGEVKRQDNESKRTTITIKDGADVTLDLNGNNVDANTSNNSVITIKQGGELTLTDSAAQTVTDEEGNEKYQSGAVTGGNGRDSNGVYNEGGTVTMNGGAISGNTATNGDGGGVFNWKGGTFTLNGGKISGNTVNGGGGGVYNTIGTFTMNGGKISGNTAAYGGGGGVHNRGTFTMDGGEISGNTAYGGGVKNLDGTFTLSGGAISGNKATAGDEISIIRSSATLPEDSLWKSDEVGDRGDPSSARVYTGAEVNGMKQTLYLKHHEHKFTEEQITKQPTCTEKGEMVGSGCACGRTVTVELDPLGHDMTGEWEVTKQPTPGVAGEERRDCQREGCDHFETRATDPLPVPSDPVVTIEDPETPLAGLFTRADAIGYLWEQSGKPEAELSAFEDVPEDHEWAVAIGWAQDMGIAVADEDGNFRPDDLVERWTEDLGLEPEGELQEFLNRYALFAGVEPDAGELFIELGGEADDVVMGEDAQAIFNEFFAKLEAALAAQEDEAA